MAGRRGRPTSPRLSRAEIVDAAVAVADAGGVGAVSMRSVADHLGVAAMSLYHHVGGKEELLDAIVDAVFAAMSPPRPGRGWRAELGRSARSAREVLHAHPWALGLMDSRRTPGAATLDHHDHVLGFLRSAGFSVPLAAHAIALLDSYVHGFVLQQVSLPFQAPGEVPEVATELAGVMEPGRYPHLEELIRDHALAPGYDFGDEFGWGLELVLDGLERRLGAG